MFLCSQKCFPYVEYSTVAEHSNYMHCADSQHTLLQSFYQETHMAG